MTRGLKEGILGLCMGFCIVITACSLFYDKDDVDFVDGVAFSPSKECENTIIKLINSSSEQIDVAVFDINNENIVNALKSAHDKGKKIRILTDKRQAGGKHSKVLELYESGINIRVHSKHRLEHNKFGVFDKKYVINGSYNWTNSASLRNSENCQLSVENEEIIEDYQSRFEKLWRINTKKKSDAWFKKKLNQKQYNNNKFITNKQQKQIKNALEKSINKYSAKGGAVIVMNADNSQVLSMSSIYEGNGTFNYISDYKYNVGAAYMPFVVAMGLENNIITEDTIFDLSKLRKSKKHDVDTNLQNKTITTEDILAFSSNIASAKISTDTGSKKHLKFLSAIGFDDEISLGDIKTEKTTLPKKFNKKTLKNVGIGFGFEVTPLHLTTAYASLVNGGVYHAPSLEKSVKNDGKYVISAENSQKMRKYLRKVVTDGTAKLANVKNVEFMAKTGTSSKKIDGIYSAEQTITTVIGNFKYKDTHYVIFVLLDEPKSTKETYGFASAGWNAVPTAKEVINIITAEK